MKKITIYHNSKCSKSKQALEILQNKSIVQNKGIELIVIEYLKTPLGFEELKKLRGYFTLDNFVRTQEAIFTELKLSLDDEDKILAAMAKNPILMQRPILFRNGLAMIARSPEKVFEFLET